MVCTTWNPHSLFDHFEPQTSARRLKDGKEAKQLATSKC
jgi:hypothetical protein